MKTNKSDSLQSIADTQERENSIMVVDDSKFARNILCDILRNDGFRVVAEAKNGLEAVELTREKRPEYIFLDVEMPVMDGLGAIPRILEIEPKTHIIMCTAMGQKNIIVEAVKAGARDYVIKPYKKENILRVLNIILESKKNSANPNDEDKESKTQKAEISGEERKLSVKKDENGAEINEVNETNEISEIYETNESNEDKDEINENSESNEGNETGEINENNETIENSGINENSEIKENTGIYESNEIHEIRESVKNNGEGVEAFPEVPQTEASHAAGNIKKAPSDMETVTDSVILEAEEIYQSLPSEVTISADEQEAVITTEASTASTTTEGMEEAKVSTADKNKEVSETDEAVMQTDLSETDENTVQTEASVTDEAIIQTELSESDEVTEQTEVSTAGRVPLQTESSEADEAAILLEVLQTEKDPELIAFLEELAEKDYGMEADRATGRAARQHLIDIKGADIKAADIKAVDTGLDDYYLSYLWRDRLDFNRDGSVLSHISARRLFFDMTIALQEHKDALKKTDEQSNGLLSGLAMAYLQTEQRLQPQEINPERLNMEYPEGKRIFTGTLLEERKGSRSEISIRDLLAVSASREVNRSVIRMDTLSEAVARLVSEKAERTL